MNLTASPLQRSHQLDGPSVPAEEDHTARDRLQEAQAIGRSFDFDQRRSNLLQVMTFRLDLGKRSQAIRMDHTIGSWAGATSLTNVFPAASAARAVFQLPKRKLVQMILDLIKAWVMMYRRGLIKLSSVAARWWRWTSLGRELLRTREAREQTQAMVNLRELTELTNRRELDGLPSLEAPTYEPLTVDDRGNATFSVVGLNVPENDVVPRTPSRQRRVRGLKMQLVALVQMEYGVMQLTEANRMVIRRFLKQRLSDFIGLRPTMIAPMIEEIIALSLIPSTQFLAIQRSMRPPTTFISRWRQWMGDYPIADLVREQQSLRLPE